MTNKEQRCQRRRWYINGLPLIANALELLSSMPSSSAEDILYGRLSRDYQQSRESRRQSSGSSDRRQQQPASGYFYGQQPLVHTFETQSSCTRKCALPCVMQNIEDLMMPRWICPSQQSSEMASNTIQQESPSFSIPFDNQFLLLLVPLALILFIALIIIWVRRSASSSSLSNDDELV